MGKPVRGRRDAAGGSSRSLKRCLPVSSILCFFARRRSRRGKWRNRRLQRYGNRSIAVAGICACRSAEGTMPRASSAPGEVRADLRRPPRMLTGYATTPNGAKDRSWDAPRSGARCQRARTRSRGISRAVPGTAALERDDGARHVRSAARRQNCDGRWASEIVAESLPVTAR